MKGSSGKRGGKVGHRVLLGTPLGLAVAFLGAWFCFRAGRPPIPDKALPPGVPSPAEWGAFFPRREYVPQPLPDFQARKDLLPSPIFDENPPYVRCYWKVWDLAFGKVRSPLPESPFVSPFVDEGFSKYFFLWDSAFITMFCNYGSPYLPGIEALDNFYRIQWPDGEIVRQVSEQTGLPHPASRPGTPDSLNHPILAWAEREAYRISGDRSRLQRVFPPLVHYYRSFQKIRDPQTGFYRTNWASMDNSPRNDGLGCGIDTTAEMVLFARDLAFIAGQIGRKEEAASLAAEAEALADQVNRKLWDEKTGFFYDWAAAGKRHHVRTIAAFWTLLASIPDPKQVKRLVAHLQDRKEFNRRHRVPSLPANEAGYHPRGHYWRGGVWPPTNTMVIRGLERYGEHELAREIALNHLRNVVEVFQKTGTVWEFYAPDSARPGFLPSHPALPDFVGWTGLGPIVFLIEYAIGIKVDAPSHTLVWDLRSPHRVGIHNLRFGGRTVSLLAKAPEEWGERVITVKSDRAFQLRLMCQGQTREVRIPAGRAFQIRIEWKKK